MTFDVGNVMGLASVQCVLPKLQISAPISVQICLYVIHLASYESMSYGSIKASDNQIKIT